MVDTEQLRLAAHRVEKWSVGWGLTALVLWGWFGYRWLTADDPAYGTADAGNALVGILALAVIPTVVAAATTAYAQVLFRMARQAGPAGR